MSWGLASLVVLGAALAGGFAWYERSRPSARLLAVAGTLAALAVLGRIAFAPLPNVKPTTDVVLIAGYTLGGAPGFAVGAVTALVSNLFFGQGPWTPWQMGAWGLVGVFGAALARASRGRLGRIPLALACGFAGLAYGAILDGSDWLLFSGEHTLGQYLVLVGRGIPFDVAHAVGNVVFFAAFGPALVRAVRRCRLRFDVVWRPAGAAVPALLAGLVLGAAAAAPARADDAAARALAYLRAARNADGGWGAAPRQASTGLHTAWATLAYAAAGERADTARLVARLDSRTDLGDVERTILAARAAGGRPPGDLVAALRRRERPDGSFGGYVSYTAYAILALRAAGEPRGIPAAARWLAAQANRDGGFDVYRRGGASDADDTGYAIEALVAAGRRATPEVRRATAYLHRTERPDGGWSLAAGAASNAQSTAFALLGLAAAHRSAPRGLAYLRSLQRGDGSIAYSRTSHQTPVWVTAQALLALEGKPLPVAPPAAGPRPGGAVRRRIGPSRQARSKRTDGDRTGPAAAGAGTALGEATAAARSEVRTAARAAGAAAQLLFGDLLGT